MIVKLRVIFGTFVSSSCGGPKPGFSSGCASITDECNVLINNDLLNIKTRCAVDNNINKYSGNYYAEAAR